MNYPLISEYIEAIKSAEDNFEELSYLRPVLGDDGLPVMTSGNFAVVFKMIDDRTGELYAVKCFTKEEEGREEAYRDIAKELQFVFSHYLTSVRYLDKELFVDTDQTMTTEFPVLLMDWVEGKTLDKYLRENLDDKYALEMLAYRFSQLAQWLIPQPFAHGDLKPDNILVREDGTLVLVDYDGMYVPAMKGQKARELGSPDFRHPQRTENDFDERIDDFPLLSILLSLKAISNNPQLLNDYGAPDRLLFSMEDYLVIDNHIIFDYLILENNLAVNTIVAIFKSLCHRMFPFYLPTMSKPCPCGPEELYYINGTSKLSKSPTINRDKLMPMPIETIIDALDDLNDLMSANGIEYILTGTLGLYLYGFSPTNYIPHDIDIIIPFGSTTNHPFLGIESMLEMFEQYSGRWGRIYTDNDTTRMYIFNIGEYSIEVNAFFKKRELILITNNYNTMRVRDFDIKVSSVFDIFREKYKLHRLKDFEFNKEIQDTLNQYLTQQEKTNKAIINPMHDPDELPF